MWPTEDFTQKELQCKKKEDKHASSSREPVEQFDSHCSRGRRTAKNASFTHQNGEERTMQVTGSITSSRRTTDGYFGNIYQWPFTLNFAIPAGCFIKVVRRNRGDVEDETLCQRETGAPREAPRVELNQSPSARGDPSRITAQDDLPSRVPIFLVPKVDERFHGCTTIGVIKEQAREQMISSLTRVVVNHTEKKRSMNKLFISSSEAYKPVIVCAKGIMRDEENI